MNVLNDLQWADPVEVKTRNGDRMLRTATPTPAFWDKWKEDKPGIQQLGISCAKDEKTNSFVVKLWYDAGQDPLANGVAPNPQFANGAPAQTHHLAQPNSQIPHMGQPDTRNWQAPTPAQIAEPAVQQVLNTFPGSTMQVNIVGDNPIVPSLPPQGFLGMTAVQRLLFFAECGIAQALETQKVTKADCAKVLMSIVERLK